jgi:hypothetical protein
VLDDPACFASADEGVNWAKLVSDKLPKSFGNRAQVLDSQFTLATLVTSIH